jgi:O-antigen biosynthesis protein
MTEPLVSIIIPSFNGRNFLERCLATVCAQETPGYRIEFIVIDNGSSDGTSEFVHAHYSNVKLLVNERNFGFSRAVNQGVEAAQGQWLLILNNDVELPPGTLNALFALFSSVPPDVAGIQPLLVSASDHNRIDSCGIALSRGFRPRDHLHGSDLGHAPNEPTEIWGICAACVLVKRDVFEKAGGFDADYFIELDDVDFCFRVRWLGWRFLLVPQAVVFHHRSPTVKQNAREQRRRHRLNYLTMIRKDFPRGRVLRKLLYEFQRDLFNAIHLLKRGEMRTIAGVWRDFIKTIPATRQKRRATLSRAKLSPSQMHAQLQHFMSTEHDSD